MKRGFAVLFSLSTIVVSFLAFVLIECLGLLGSAPYDFSGHRTDLIFVASIAFILTGYLSPRLNKRFSLGCWVVGLSILLGTLSIFIVQSIGWVRVMELSGGAVFFAAVVWLAVAVIKRDREQVVREPVGPGYLQVGDSRHRRAFK